MALYLKPLTRLRLTYRGWPLWSTETAATKGTEVDFGRLGRGMVERHLDGGRMTSDGGVMLVSATDFELGLIEVASR